MKALSKVPFSVKIGTHIFDYVLCRLHFSAACIFVTFWQGQMHLHLAIYY